LVACTQADLDAWTADGQCYRDETAHFVRWAATHKHAHGLTFGAIRWQGPTGPHDTEKRWADARRLLHDDTLPTLDRVAGLLLLLYAQRIATITQLTTDDVHDNGDTVAITFGRVPATLPEPLAVLVRELVATRKGSNIIKASNARPWLFPADAPATPSATTRWETASNASGSTPARTAQPPCSPSPPNSRPPCWPPCSACTAKSPSPGSTPHPATGPPTPPTSAAERMGARPQALNKRGAANSRRGTYNDWRATPISHSRTTRGGLGEGCQG
jgi:hypothetical protein